MGRERSRLFLQAVGTHTHTCTHADKLSHTHTHKLPPCCLKESSSTPLVTDFDEHVIKVTQCKAMEACVIDLLAHYDAVAELMAAMGGWLENRAGSFNGLAVSYGRKFTNQKVEGKCGCVSVCVCVCERQRGSREEWLLYSLPCRVRRVKCDQQQTSGVIGLYHVMLTRSIKTQWFMGA